MLNMKMTDLTHLSSAWTLIMWNHILCKSYITFKEFKSGRVGCFHMNWGFQGFSEKFWNFIRLWRQRRWFAVWKYQILTKDINAGLTQSELFEHRERRRWNVDQHAFEIVGDVRVLSSGNDRFFWRVWCISQTFQKNLKYEIAESAKYF